MKAIGKRVVVDQPRERYEQLRTVFMEANNGSCNEFWERFELFGFFGLFPCGCDQAYVVQIYQVPGTRWSGSNDPGETILRDVFGQLIIIGQESMRT